MMVGAMLTLRALRDAVRGIAAALRPHGWARDGMAGDSGV